MIPITLISVMGFKLSQCHVYRKYVGKPSLHYFAEKGNKWIPDARPNHRVSLSKPVLELQLTFRYEMKTQQKEIHNHKSKREGDYNKR